MRGRGISGWAIFLICLIVGMVIFSIAVVATGIGMPSPGVKHVGFWMGLWHGFTVGLAFIRSWWDPNITLYQAGNGFWYNMGFIVGLGGAYGAGSSSSRSS